MTRKGAFVEPTTNGRVRSAKPMPQEYYAEELPPSPPALLETSAQYRSPAGISMDRYTSAAFLRSELEKVFPHVWQMACHTSDLPAVGDVLSYDIGRSSYLLVRSQSGDIKAFVNSCLHRGTQLWSQRGSTAELRCPFHGWAWTLEGELSDVPARWDFPDLDWTAYRLPEVHVASWNDWVFICPSDPPPVFDEFLEDLPRHFSELRPKRRCIQGHVIKVSRCNWKIALEAFLESYHVRYTHPQLTIGTGGFETEYSVLPGRRFTSRMITPIGVPGGEGEGDKTPQDVLDNMYRSGRMTGTPPTLKEGETARPTIANTLRQGLESTTGLDLSDMSIGELLDGIEYYLFPNFMLWAGFQSPLAYRFRPFGTDPDMCLIDVYVLAPLEDSADLPPAPPVIHVGADEKLPAVPELGRFSGVLEQDFSNLPYVQRGLHASTRRVTTLERYQGIRIAHYNRTLDEYLAL